MSSLKKRQWCAPFPFLSVPFGGLDECRNMGLLSTWSVQLPPTHGKGRSWERSQSVVPVGLLDKPCHLVINCLYFFSCRWILRTRSRKGMSHYSAHCCDISKLYIGVVCKILGGVPKLLRYVKENGGQLRVRFTKGISLSGKTKKHWKKDLPWDFSWHFQDCS